MKLSNYIAELIRLKEQHGDLEVCTYTWDRYRMDAPYPVIDFKAVLNGRERRQKFFNRFEAEDRGQGEQRRGEKVVRV